MAKSKYLAKKVEVDGIRFDSKKEANHYIELREQERKGLISDLQRQVSFVLIPAQYEEVVEYTPKTHKEKVVNKLLEKRLEYFADFVYYRDGNLVVEDVKGYRNSTAYAVFVIKRKLMLYVHGIRVVEI